MGDSNREFMTCLNCEKVIASFKENEDKMEPGAEECYAKERVSLFPTADGFALRNVRLSSNSPMVSGLKGL